jgi:L-alanine-DL-glutamate epimerase-like enolase superfamily enzyme
MKLEGPLPAWALQSRTPTMPPTRSSTKRRVTGLVIVAAAATTSCTTFIQPTTCEPGSTSCGGIHDARFCEYVATAVEGTACAAVGLAEARHFCVVTTTACVDTSYAVKDQDCRVLSYETLRDGMRADCPPGAPMFVNR